jgi:hypothetical protein
LLNIEFVLHEKELDNFTRQTIIRVCELVSEQLDLPDKVQIEYKKLSDSTYGETSLNPRFRNRVTINSLLSSSELIQPLIHELIHLHQIHTNKLEIRRDGVFVWCGKKYDVNKTLSYQEYLDLPWENDVINKIKILTKNIIDNIR